MPEQYPCRKVHKITRCEIMSLGCPWEGVPTRKQQDLGITKQCTGLPKYPPISYLKVA